MKPTRRTLSVALLAAFAAPAAHAEIAIDVIGGSEITLEGLIQADYNDFDNDVVDLNGDAADGSDADNELRRAEIVLKGKGPGNIDWVVGYDAKADRWLDVNARYKIGGDSNHFVQLGQFKQPNSLEELSSTKNNDFISKAAATNTFAVARRLGVGYGYGGSDWGVTASYFTRELTRNMAHGAGYGVRGYWAPMNEKGRILHLGLSFVDLDSDNDNQRLRTRPQADLSIARLVDTGNLTNVDRQQTIGAEAMWVIDRFKLQAEYMRASLDRYPNGNPRQSRDFDGNSWYVSGVWNITGETWGYKGGVPTTPLPDEPGVGMWQLGARYDRIDLDDGALLPPATPTGAPIVDGVLGGHFDAWTLGVNWYWRSNFKFMVNYVRVDSERYSSSARRVVSDDPNILEARVQFYW
ncbi:MAG TPA: OprO/OprP family phosphate-selective porin [Lysobacter sp.]|nr:OprO/OprP family phosphate-selective porin [Lysobacter sp.]